ncbi:hypothetical protein L6R29_06520 [Myxococcota bacterium]|nr:hypothetical protein [Myxococcota bacterium]
MRDHLFNRFRWLVFVGLLWVGSPQKGETQPPFDPQPSPLTRPLRPANKPPYAAPKQQASQHKTQPSQNPSNQAAPTVPKQLPHTLRTKHFTLRYPTDLAWLARRIAERMEQDYLRIAEELGYKEHAHFEIRMARVDRDYAAIQPHAWTPHAWIAGLAYPRQGLMTLRQQPGQGFPQIYQTFVHELSHLILFRAARFEPMPLWFVEAVAMQQSNDNTAFDRFLTLATAQISGRIPPIPSLSRRFPTDGSSATLAYATSFAHLQFLRSHAPDLLPRVLELLRAGQSFDHALTNVLGQPHARLLPAWQQHLRSHYHWIALLAHETLWLTLFSLLLPFFYLRQKALRKQQIAQMHDDPSPEDPPSDLLSALPPSNASLSYPELRRALEALHNNKDDFPSQQAPPSNKESPPK